MCHFDTEIDGDKIKYDADGHYNHRHCTDSRQIYPITCDGDWVPGSLWSLLTSLSLSLRSEDTPEEEPVVLVVAASKLESERTLASLAWLNSPSPELTDSRRPASSRDTEDTSSVFSRWRSSSRASSS